MRPRRQPPQYIDLIPVTPPGTTASLRAPLVREQPELITTDPITGAVVRCADLRDAAEQCFASAYAVAGDRSQLGVCYVRARHVVRTCGLGVSITGRRSR
jgi:hypothetical protein